MSTVRPPAEGHPPQSGCPLLMAGTTDTTGPEKGNEATCEAPFEATNGFSVAAPPRY